MAPACLLSLPTELLVEILISLDFGDVLRCQAVCKQLDDVVRSTALLQYKIELATSGLTDGPPDATLPLSDRRGCVKDYQRAFEIPSWCCKKEIQMSEVSSDAMPIHVEYRGNLFMRAYEEGRNTMDTIAALAFGAWDGLEKFDTVEVTHIMSDDEEVKTNNWKLHFGRMFDYWAIDPAQDLLVCWGGRQLTHPDDSLGRGSFRLSVFSITHGAPVLDHEFLWLTPSGAGNMRSRLIEVHIMGDLLGAMAISSGGTRVEVMLVDWKRRRTVARLIRDFPGDVRSKGFALFSYSCFILAIADATDGNNCFKIEVYNIPDHANFPDNMISATPVLAATFVFPSLASDLRPVSIIISPTASGDPYRAKDFPKPFSTSPSAAMLAVTLIHMKKRPESIVDIGAKRFLMFMHPSTFLSVACTSEPDAGPRTYDWDSWGPNATRWFKLHTSFRATHGYRAAFINSIVDFNPLEIARALKIIEQRDNSQDDAAQEHDIPCVDVDEMVLAENPELVGEEDDGENSDGVNVPTKKRPIVTLILGESILEAGEDFVEDVVSRLPFREVRCAAPEEFGRMWGGENWIAVETDDDDRPRTLRVLSYMPRPQPGQNTDSSS